SGLVAWLLLGVSVVGGLLLAVRLTQGRSRAWTRGLHEFVGALAVVFTAVHLLSVLAADQLRIGPRKLVIPFTRPDNPVAQGCGVLACYLLAAVALTSWARASLPWRWWRRCVGRVIDVPGDRSVLQAVREVLPAVAAGCEQGIYGAYRTTVLAGEPNHRDDFSVAPSAPPVPC
ncbi:MAG: 2Fe-2S iron-sulfur cluster binding domain-containing protein, partial [Pseudonocardiales bacterium]|nr:2Fe-2S iron-sulfur cluster binding domain-containing protein [Pseudonocardiales bacterium]